MEGETKTARIDQKSTYINSVYSLNACSIERIENCFEDVISLLFVVLLNSAIKKKSKF